MYRSIKLGIITNDKKTDDWYLTNGLFFQVRYIFIEITLTFRLNPQSDDDDCAHAAPHCDYDLDFDPDCHPDRYSEHGPVC